MRKTMVIPTYWSRKSTEKWQEGDAIYDHPTPVDKEGTLARTLESMKILKDSDFKLVILVCTTTEDVEAEAYAKVQRIVKEADLKVETYIFTDEDLRQMRETLQKSGLDNKALSLMDMKGYANVRNICLVTAAVLTADSVILIDDDEVFEIPDFVSRSTEFLGKRVYGDVVHGMAGYYINKKDQYYDDVIREPWMTYWDRFGCKAAAFDKIIGSEPRIKRTPFAFGGAMMMHRELYECVPFDPLVTRGEDLDYLINSRMYGFSFFLDNTLSIKHLPEPKSHPKWMRVREDIYRFVYQRAKLNAQHETGNMMLVTPEELEPYPGDFLKDDLEEKVYRSSLMLAMEYLTKGDIESCQETLKNIEIFKYDAMPDFDAFEAYRRTQKNWVDLIKSIKENRYALRSIMEHNNTSCERPQFDKTHLRKVTGKEVFKQIQDLEMFSNLTSEEMRLISGISSIKAYDEWEKIFSEGDDNDGVSIILCGKVQLTTSARDDLHKPQIDLTEIGPNEFIGENCLVKEAFRVNGTAMEYTEMLYMGRTDLNQLIERHPELGVKLFKLLLKSYSEKINRANNTLKQAMDYEYSAIADEKLFLKDTE